MARPRELPVETEFLIAKVPTEDKKMLAVIARILRCSMSELVRNLVANFVEDYQEQRSLEEGGK